MLMRHVGVRSGLRAPGVHVGVESPSPLATTARPAVWQLLWLFALALMLWSGVVAGRWAWHAYVDPGPLPRIDRLDLYARFVDLTPISVTVGGTLHAPWRTTVDELQRNPAVWRLMHLENWNTVPSSVREQAFEAMLARYRTVLMDPGVWDSMTTADWDRVPQPVRTVAYRQMTSYWIGFYGVGERYLLDRRHLRDTLQAIVMSESWFEHRAERVDVTGNHDIGLAQASDYARERVRHLASRGELDVSLIDDEYWNPWKATRFLAMWMALLLEETRGDLDRAVRAYNRGIANADDARGDAYLARVQQRRRRFIQNREAPPAWTWLWHRARQIEAESWPWLHGDPVVSRDVTSSRAKEQCHAPC